MQGFISLHRKLMDNPVWCDPHYLKLWMYCLFSASHKKHEQLIGNQVVFLGRGQFITGRFSLAEELNKGMKPSQQLDSKTWFRYLKNLEKCQMLTIKSTNKYSLVTIDKYDLYQNVFNKVDHQIDQQLTISCPSDDQQLTTNNNVNKGNKENNKKTSSPKSKIYDDGSPYMKMAKYFQKKILGWKSNYVFRGSLQKWADHFRLIHENDKRSKEDIKAVIDWCTSDPFWQANILSPDKLRKQFDTLQGQMKRPKFKSNEQLQQEKKRDQFDYQVQLNRWIENGGDPDEFVYQPN